MKLASLRSGRDGTLIVVSRNLKTAVKVPEIAATMQAALDNWSLLEAKLQSVSLQLNSGSLPDAFPLVLNDLMAPLPRAYQYIDGACYLSHIKRNRAARGETLPDDLLEKPMIYQGISHGYMSWNADAPFPSEEFGIDIEGEIAAITGDIAIGSSAADASKAIRLFVLLNDFSLRALIPPELKRTFGFLVSKPASSLGPIAVTPDELGELWDGRLVGGTLKCWIRGELIGAINTGIDTPFCYGDMIAHVAQTRPFEPGSIVGLGTVSNEDDSVGCACIGELRAVETLKTGAPKTSLLKFGDTLRIEHFDTEGRSVFGAIEQTIVAHRQ